MFPPQRPADPDARQRWRNFLRNQREVLAAMDFFTVPTATFRVLYVFFVIHHARRAVLHFRVTEHPTASTNLAHANKNLQRSLASWLEPITGLQNRFEPPGPPGGLKEVSMSQNSVTQMSWKASAQAVRERIESDVRTQLLPRIATGRNALGEAVIAIGQKLQAPKR
jgi:hypothetical protein